MALDPARTADQYIHERWESDRGFPGGAVHAIAQSSDGYLWIAGDKGLVRFDGLTFHLFQQPSPTRDQDPAVLAISAAATDGLWVQLGNAMLTRFRDGHFEDLPTAFSAFAPAVTALSPSGGDSILLAILDHGILRYRAGHLETVVPQHAMLTAVVMAMAQTSDRDVWLGTRDSGLLRLHGGQLLSVVTGLPDQKINALVAGSRNDLWIGTDGGVSHWNGHEITTADLPPALHHVGALAMTRDRDGNIWIGTSSGELLRMNEHGVVSLDDGHGARRGAVTAVFEDRDRNVWIGTNRGIERLRDGAFTTYSQVQGLPEGAPGPVFAHGDRVWTAPTAGGLFAIGNGRATHVSVPGLTDDVIYSISGDDLSLWLGRQRGGLTELRIRGTQKAATFTKADGLAQNNVYAVHRARDGAVWAGTLSAGLSRLKNGVFTTYTTRDGLSSNTISAIAEADDGTLWVATPNGLNHQEGSGWRRFGVADGLPSNDVNTLAEDSMHDLWIGTAAGLALARGGRVVPIQAPDRLRGSVVGIAEDRAGLLWVATTERLVRVDRTRLATNTVGDADVREFDASDGLAGIEGVKRHRSVTTDREGRIWLSTTRGLSMADPDTAADRAAPALVAVDSLVVDGNLLRGVPLTLPAHPQRLGFSFAAPSLGTPERVQFRYRLDGFDHEWSAPTSTRQAIYTNLGPGEYSFRVRASNGDGRWSAKEAVMHFSIAPSFWQTTWFQIAILVVATTMAWGAYRVRMSQFQRQLNVRFEERLAERTRIARELHDTLLQGFLSASMQLHVAADRVPNESPAKPPLAKVLQLMGRVIEEGRNAVRGLRSPDAGSADLHRAFTSISEEFGVVSTIEYHVIAEGRERPLNPLIRDEIYRIGREAIVNAFRHSAASRVDVAVEYGVRTLRLIVRDNGRGIDAKVLEFGRDGHWGLPGMRERADRIGAAFRVWSSAAEGTEVELSVPARVAFASETNRDRIA